MLLKFVALYLSPLFIAVGLAFAILSSFHLHEKKDIIFLAISAAVPTILSSALRRFQDKRDRIKNISQTINTQLLALPLVPITFFLLEQCFPGQQDPAPFVFCIQFFIIGTLIANFLPEQKKPWLIKEKLETLRSELMKQEKKDSIIPSYSLTPKLKQELMLLRQEISKLAIVAKNASDYIDKGDMYKELGHLELLSANYPEAEKNYVNAIEAYDDALSLELENTAAKTSKSDSIERLNQVRLYINNANMDT